MLQFLRPLFSIAQFIAYRDSNQSSNDKFVYRLQFYELVVLYWDLIVVENACMYCRG